MVSVFIPDRWAEFADYEEEDEEINLHDMAKAHRVQRGIASQFLRQSMVRKKFDSEVMWWLALSSYAKVNEDTVDSRRPAEHDSLRGPSSGY